jgi:hypothetical protein
MNSSATPYNQGSSFTELRPNPFSDRFNAAMRDLHCPVSTTDELRAMVKPFARDEAHLQELTNKLVSAAEANLPESGQFAIFGVRLSGDRAATDGLSAFTGNPRGIRGETLSDLKPPRHFFLCPILLRSQPRRRAVF